MNRFCSTIELPPVSGIRWSKPLGSPDEEWFSWNDYIFVQLVKKMPVKGLMIYGGRITIRCGSYKWVDIINDFEPNTKSFMKNHLIKSISHIIETAKEILENKTKCEFHGLKFEFSTNIASIRSEKGLVYCGVDPMSIFRRKY